MRLRALNVKTMVTGWAIAACVAVAFFSLLAVLP